MGLLLGGSVLTVCELLDLLIFNFFKKLMRRRETEEKIRQRALEGEREELESRQREAVQKVTVSHVRGWGWVRRRSVRGRWSGSVRNWRDDRGRLCRRYQNTAGSIVSELARGVGNQFPQKTALE